MGRNRRNKNNRKSREAEAPAAPGQLLSPAAVLRLTEVKENLAVVEVPRTPDTKAGSGRRKKPRATAPTTNNSGPTHPKSAGPVHRSQRKSNGCRTRRSLSFSDKPAKMNSTPAKMEYFAGGSFQNSPAPNLIPVPSFSPSKQGPSSNPDPFAQLLSQVQGGSVKACVAPTNPTQTTSCRTAEIEMDLRRILKIEA